jgi:hypothetical protein
MKTVQYLAVVSLQLIMLGACGKSQEGLCKSPQFTGDRRLGAEGGRIVLTAKRDVSWGLFGNGDFFDGNRSYHWFSDDGGGVITPDEENVKVNFTRGLPSDDYLVKIETEDFVIIRETNRRLVIEIPPNTTSKERRLGIDILVQSCPGTFYFTQSAE